MSPGFEMCVWRVRDLPPMLDRELVERHLATAPRADWRLVADLSVEAVNQKSLWTVDEWLSFGNDRMKKKRDRRAFHSLIAPPICIGADDGWLEGRHRSLLMILAGAEAFAAAVP